MTQGSLIRPGSAAELLSGLNSLDVTVMSTHSLQLLKNTLGNGNIFKSHKCVLYFL